MLHLDSPEATPLSQYSTEPEPVESPAPVDLGTHYDTSDDEPLYISEFDGEEIVPGRLVPAGGDPLYLPLPKLGVESGETEVFDKYWQRHVGKKSAQTATRSFFVKGKCKWQGQKITDSQQLAQFFEASLIRTVSTKLQEERTWWHHHSRTQDPPHHPTPAQTRTITMHSLRIITYNMTTAYNGHLDRTLKMYENHDVLCLQGTRFPLHNTNLKNAIAYEKKTPMRREWHSRCGTWYI